MTINKKEMITIPKWKVIWGTPIVLAILTSLLTVTAFKASIDEKMNNQEKATQQLYDSKADRKEQELILKSLERIESKLDEHIAQPSKQ